MGGQQGGGENSQTMEVDSLTKQNPGSPKVCVNFRASMFRADEVYKITNRGRCVFGRVGAPLQSGEIRVAWHPSGLERVVAEDTVVLSDRYIGRGRMVRRVGAGKDTQLGHCTDCRISTTLQVVGTKYVLQGVLSDRLEPLEECVHFVGLDGWVGIAAQVNIKLHLVSSDGSRLEYADSKECPLEDYVNYRRATSNFKSCKYYVGQVLYGETHSIHDSYWTHTTDEMKAARKNKGHKHKFTVEALVTEKIDVNWLCREPTSATSAAAQEPEQPSSHFEGNNLQRLKLLKVSKQCAPQHLGKLNFITISRNDVFLTKKQWQKGQSRKYQQSRPSKKEPKESEEYAVPSNSKSRKRASNNSRYLSVSSSTAKRAKMCKQSQMEVEVDDAGPSTSGNVQRSAAAAAGGSLQHTRAAAESGIRSGGAHNIINHNLHEEDSDYWENTSEDGRRTDSGATCSSVASTRTRGQRTRRRSARAVALRPRPGCMVAVEILHTDRKVEVVWQDGTVETDIPSTELYLARHLDGQECFPGVLVVSDAASGDDNHSQNSPCDHGVVQKVDLQGKTAIVKWFRTNTNVDEPAPQLMSESEVSADELKDHPHFQDYEPELGPKPVIIRVANFTGRDTGRRAGVVMDKCPSGRVKVMWANGDASICRPQHLQILDDDDGVPTFAEILLFGRVQPSDDEGFSLLGSAPAAHHFLSSKLQPSEPRAFCSAVEREIKLLKSDLPSGVWVRGFEDRMDLMSLMIAGAKKTPYEGGLFLFDLQLGGDYPRRPPSFHYISYSGRLNPNLYMNGMVCVSLLGTWPGQGVELWSKDSSLLQVILSLQALILNAEPYFNEPGHQAKKSSRNGKVWSRSYNEKVVLLLLESMTKLMVNPPDIFRAEILRHFRAGADDMCRRLEAWVVMSYVVGSTARGSSVSFVAAPDFPLLPVRSCCCRALRSSLETFRRALRCHDQSTGPPRLAELSP